MRPIVLLASVALGASALPANAATVTVETRDNTFAPATRTVSVGDTVTWTNTGRAPHEVTASAFKSGNIDPGTSWSWRTSKAGTFSYVCTYHEAVGMKGTLVVRAAGVTGHPDTGGDHVRLGLLLLAVSVVGGASLRLVWRTR